MNFPAELRDRFKSFITDRCGLYFRDFDLKNLENAIISRMRSAGVDSFIKYYDLLLGPNYRQEEFRELLNLLTVGHTYFFRNEEQFSALKEKILPEIIERKIAGLSAQGQTKRPSLRIWSAGCSTGEEPYTIAMILQDIIPDLQNWDITIIATDASTNAIDKARKGVYNETSVRLADQEHRDRYFSARKSGSANEYAINQPIKDMVTFSFLNLADDDFPAGFDVIFCRNVFIYFELETILKIINKFHDSLLSDGFLLIGYAESLQFITDKFKMKDFNDGIYYVKGAPGHYKSFEMPRPAIDDIEDILRKISEAELSAEIKEIPQAQQARPQRLDEVLMEILKNIHLKEYAIALDLIGKAHSVDKNAIDPYYFAAEIFANQGQFLLAKNEIRAATKLNDLFVPAYHLLGVINIREGNAEEAVKNFRKALYIDKAFVLAYFSLANLYKDEHRPQEAIREYRNALNILSKHSFDDIIAYSGGFNAATLISVCKNDIERIKVEQWT